VPTASGLIALKLSMLDSEQSRIVRSQQVFAETPATFARISPADVRVGYFQIQQEDVTPMLRMFALPELHKLPSAQSWLARLRH